MFHVILHRPEIPPNTGNIIRLAANTGAHLHLVRPLGFSLDDRALARAGLDYHDLARVSVHDDLSACLATLGDARCYALSRRGSRRYDRVAYKPGDALLFGSETCGLGDDVLQQFDGGRCLRLPMVPGNRSLNLSNAVAVVMFEVWRQNGFAGEAGAG
ncbi:MAG: tRNA (cytidine(34)-2'-O)-methyltransferase [Rhodocyclaceae bacterium]|nr:tRNA (cytidine(34)-2'-O)-methyltransferase [Rhodocyclaceae bacterium]